MQQNCKILVLARSCNGSAILMVFSQLKFPRFHRLNRVSSMKVMGWKETTPEIKKTAQILEMSHILGRVFKHSDEEDARQSFVEMDTNNNGVIDLEELMTGLRNAGFTPAELEDLRKRISILYAEGFELDFDLFVKIVCPHGHPDLGELLLDVQFKGAVGVGGELSITIQRAIRLIAMDDGGTSDPYIRIKVGGDEQKTSVKLRSLNPGTCRHAAHTARACRHACVHILCTPARDAPVHPV